MDENQEIVESRTKNENSLWEFIKVIIISLAIVLPIRTFVAQPFIVEGSSMEPNFKNGQYLIIDELSYFLRDPKRGEVIVFRYPIMPSEYFIKRIVGLPGETVNIKSGEVFITTKEGKEIILEESYLPPTETTSGGTWSLGDGQYFVLGDNRGASSDSRFWGILPKKNIIGRAFIRLWPIGEAKIIN